jgi:glutamyl-tRNA reductase
MGKQHASASVGVIGAGKMGSALAEVLLERGIHRLEPYARPMRAPHELGCQGRGIGRGRGEHGGSNDRLPD